MAAHDPNPAGDQRPLSGDPPFNKRRNPGRRRRLHAAVAQPTFPYYTCISKEKEMLMDTDATLTSKGQTTIPKRIRDSLGMKAGDRMSFTLMPDGVVVMRVKNKRVADLAGILHKKGRKPIPIDLLSR
jgi:antitoxin PrlF